VASALLHGKVAGRTESLVVAAVESRWATSGDMVDAIEQLAIEALVLTAEAEDGLDDLEDGLFRFGRVVAAQPELRAALASTSLPAEGKDELLGTLLRGKVTPVTLRLITQMVDAPARARAARGPGHVRQHRGPAPRAADRGGAFGGRADRGSATAARRRSGRHLRAPGAPERRR